VFASAGPPIDELQFRGAIRDGERAPADASDREHGRPG
jgi:hypothetical protein